MRLSQMFAGIILAVICWATLTWLLVTMHTPAETWCLTLDRREYVAVGKPRSQHGYVWRWTDTLGQSHRYYTVSRGGSYVRECTVPASTDGEPSND